MNENELSKIVLDTSFHIHKTLGPGLFETVYKAILKFELEKNHGLFVECEKPIPVIWGNLDINLGFRADMIVNSKILVETKSISNLADVHKKQLLSYLKLTNMKLGLLLNFNEAYLRNGICRIVNGLEDDIKTSLSR